MIRPPRSLGPAPVASPSPPYVAIYYFTTFQIRDNRVSYETPAAFSSRRPYLCGTQPLSLPLSARRAPFLSCDQCQYVGTVSGPM